ncbi:alpha N-terminal protein methyltransferase 1-like protein [Rhizoclosmatium globosum]|uniref:Alpha N-terminal protein methyltransferase 1 n=1 Tax=Rhizoclosmatium globosum TaxID=329046 RepID=A0A1Y2B3N5_9FUNG|nr:alpha N-terminal protein methyltransferase 1-like protein [Rhizoclosmatium globosum]|eukprot:ORY29433.1 alpha N-terminal protein methyltransferase 1-like protein [Rhizoclosmatium globosum]
MFSVAAAPETPNDKISYKKAADYWDKIDPSIEGMLGGFGTLTELDCATSIRFITEFCTQTNSALALEYACDCGAGIGRVSKNFLLNVFKKVDLVEQNPKFLEQAKVDYMKEEVTAGKVGDFFPLGLQDFNPEVGRYDMIWSQWVLGHLTDDDLLAFFLRCKAALKPNGVIGVKENVCPRGVVELDEQDSSVTRPAKALEAVFEKAGLKILKRAVQTGFPRGLYPVNMYLLQ